MKRSILTLLSVIIAYAGFAQDSKKRDKDFIKSALSGSFVTYSDAKPLKETRSIKELTSVTEDGGISTFLLMQEENNFSQNRIGANIDTISKNVSVFPNPINNNFTIRTNVPNISTSLTFELYDKAGRLVKKINDINSQGEISLSKDELIFGEYIYNILSGTKIIWSGRLIIN
jgi:hypothetical protein